MTGTPERSDEANFFHSTHTLETSMTKISRLLAIAGCAGALLSGTAFAQSASSGAMSSGDHMTSGSMSTMKSEHKSSGKMMSHGHEKMAAGDHMKTSHMKSSHMKPAKHSKNKKMSHHMPSGAMSSGH